eukprot:CCRYP_008331-RA/>CCRYP_008331-RA protein AED:0.47 eAED:0.47 QI:75/1/1/1/0/0/2/7/48
MNSFILTTKCKGTMLLGRGATRINFVIHTLLLAPFNELFHKEPCCTFQ